MATDVNARAGFRAMLLPALLGAVFVLISGCGSTPMPTSRSNPPPTFADCPTPTSALPALTRKIARSVVGRSVAVCGLVPATDSLNRTQFRVTAPWVEVVAVDGIRLPAKVNLQPDRPRRLQRTSYCTEEPGGTLHVLVGGRWYAARSVSCATNL